MVYWEASVEQFFTVSGGWNSATCTLNKQFPRDAYKSIVLKNFSKSTDTHKKHSSGGFLSKQKIFLKIFQNPPKKIFAGDPFLIK